MKQSRFPKGWDEKRVSDLLSHYETQTEDEMVAEDEATLLDPEQTIMEIPSNPDFSPRGLREAALCAINVLRSTSYRTTGARPHGDTV